MVNKLVDLGTKFNLNHIYQTADANDTMAGGTTYQQKVNTQELFERPLALASDLKRLPILRGLSGGIRAYASLRDNMLAAGCITSTVICSVYNGDVEADNLIGRWAAHAFYWDATKSFDLEIEPVTWDYEGGVLLMDEINIVFELANAPTNPNNFGASWAYDLFLEIDWTPVSKAQLQDFIMEYLYARGD